MSILDREALGASPLADLHALASELSIDGYRRLRKPELIDAILTRQGGEASTGEPATEPAEDEERPAGRRRRRAPAPAPEEPAAEPAEEPAAELAEEPAAELAEEPAAELAEEPAAELAEGPAAEPAEEPDAEPAEDEERPAGRRRRGRRGGRGREAKSEEDGATALEQDEERTAEPEAAELEAPEPKSLEPEGLEEPVGPPPRGGRAAAEDVIVEGEVDLLPNGSGFLRVSPPDPSEDDVYVSAAQVKRCELVPGDKISGPRRAPRRSERFASLVRIDTINGRPAEEVVDSTRFDDLPAAFPTERFKLGSDDPTIKAVEWLTPFGQGSRVTIVGPARAGKTEALRRLAAALAEHQGVQVSLVLAGVRPEELSEWQEGPVAPVAAVSFAASADAQAHTLERAVDQGRRLAARGAHVVVLADTLSGIPLHPARKLMASAKNIAGGGSLTVIATASESLGGETTVIALDPLLASTGRFPAVDLLASWTLRPELLVGQAGAEAIARARMEAVDR